MTPSIWPICKLTKPVDGDSGSWVVDATTGNVYGHIVAGDPNTEIAYVVPARDVFQQIKLRYDAEPHFPSAADKRLSSPSNFGTWMMKWRGRIEHLFGRQDSKPKNLGFIFAQETKAYPTMTGDQQGDSPRWNSGQTKPRRMRHSRDLDDVLEYPLRFIHNDELQVDIHI